MATPRGRLEFLHYKRTSVASGAELGFGNPAIVNALARADELAVALEFRQIGDSILYLAVVRACQEYYFLSMGCVPPWILVGPHAQLLRQSPPLSESLYMESTESLVAYAQSDRRNLFVLTDIADFKMPSPSYAYRKADFSYPVYLEQLPEKAVRQHRSLSSRYFLTFEKQVGRRLVSDPSEAHPGFVFPESCDFARNSGLRFGSRSKRTLCAFIATTNLPEKKQFGVARFAQIAAQLRQRWSRDLCFVIIVSPGGTELNGGDSSESEGKICRDNDIHICLSSNLHELGNLFARCSLIIGNDTGLTHLASVSRTSTEEPPSVIALYSRHDYTRWSSGGRNIFPIYTPFSEFLRVNNLATITDGVDDGPWGVQATAKWISVDDVASLALRLLERRSSNVH